MNLAFYGTLRDPEVLRHVTGRDLDSHFAGTIELSGYECLRIEGEAYPLLRTADQGSTLFDLYHEIPEDSFQRLVAYEGDEYEVEELMISGQCYLVFIARAFVPSSRERWDLSTFQRLYKVDYMRNLVC